MPNAPYNLIEEWDALLQTVKETEGELKGVVPFRHALSEALERARAVKSVKDNLRTSGADADARLKELLGVGEDAAVALRNFIRGVLGMRNEKLLRYGIQPRGRYRGPKRTLEPAPPGCRRKVKARAR